jgi:hypothetical protein
LARNVHPAAAMRTVTTLVIVAAAAFASVGFVRQTAQGTPKTVKEVMTTMTIPASDAIFAAASDPPASAEQWADVRKSAVTLAESGRLLTSGALARDKAAWMDMAGALVKEAEATVKVAEARDREALEKASDRVYTTCETCHERYMTAVN